MKYKINLDVLCKSIEYPVKYKYSIEFMNMFKKKDKINNISKDEYENIKKVIVSNYSNVIKVMKEHKKEFYTKAFNTLFNAEFAKKNGLKQEQWVEKVQYVQLKVDPKTLGEMIDAIVFNKSHPRIEEYKKDAEAQQEKIETIAPILMVLGDEGQIREFNTGGCEDKDYNSLKWVKDDSGKITDRSDDFYDSLDSILEGTGYSNLSEWKGKEIAENLYNGLGEKFIMTLTKRLNNEFSDSICKHGKFTYSVYGEDMYTSIIFGFKPNFKVL